MGATIYFDGDPSKVDVGGYTKGDVLAANAAGNLTPVPVGTNTEILTADSADAEGVDWAASGSGTLANTVVAQATWGAASTAGVSTEQQRGDHTHGTPNIRMRQAYITSGNTTFPNTVGAWLPLAGFTLSIPAAVGDYVEIGAEFFFNPPGGSGFLDVGVLVGGSIVRYMSSGGAVPAVEGMPGWYPTVSFRTIFSPMGFVVTAPDLSAGNVVWSLASKSDGTGTLFSSAAGPFYWRTFNWGAVN